MSGRARAGKRADYVYYACATNRPQHHHQPWYAEHPGTLTITESQVLPVLGTFFAEHVLGADRVRLLATTPEASPPPTEDAEARAVHAQLAKLDRARTNLLDQLEAFEPTGDDDADAEWRTSLKHRFTAITAERRRAADRAAQIQARPTPTATSSDDQAALLNLLPLTSRDLTTLPEQVQRQLYDAFQLKILYHPTQRRVTIQITVSAATVNDLADSLTLSIDGTCPPPDAAAPRAHAVSTPGGTRTRTGALLRRLPLPLGYGGLTPG